MVWWHIEAKMWNKNAGVKRQDGEKVNSKWMSINAERVPWEEVLSWYVEQLGEGWDTVALWMEEA